MDFRSGAARPSSTRAETLSRVASSILTLTTDALKQGWGGTPPSPPSGRPLVQVPGRPPQQCPRALGRLLSHSPLGLLTQEHGNDGPIGQPDGGVIHQARGTKSPLLCKEVSKLGLWCVKRDTHLGAVFLKGQGYIIADALPR